MIPHQVQHQNLMRIKDYAEHNCNLQKESDSCLPTLPPQSGYLRRTIQNFRKWMTVNKLNQRTRQFFRSTAAIIYERRRQIYMVPPYVIHPFSKLSVIIEVSLFFLWTFGYFVDPLFVAFRNPGDSLVGPLEVCACFMNVLQLCHIFLCLITGYQIQKTKEIILVPRKIIRHYIGTYFFIDLLGSIPFRYICLCLDAHVDEIYFQVLHCTHLLRIFRIFTVLRYSRQLTLMLTINDHLHVVFSAILLTLFILHWWTCAVYFIHMIFYYNNGSIGDFSWIKRAGIGAMHNVHWGRKYIVCLHKVMCVFYGAGIGMYRSQVSSEHMLLALIAICGSVYYAFCLVITIQLVGSLNSSNTQYEVFLYQMNDYMQAKKLPQELRQRIIMYYEHRFQKKYFREQAILATLSDHLRLEIFLQSCKHLLEKVNLFHRLPKQIVGIILATLKQEVYFPNDVILKIGTESYCMYLISYGTVAVYSIRGREYVHLDDGNHFGARNLVRNPEDVYPFNCVAVEMTELYRWDKADYLKCLATYEELADEITNLIRTFSDVENIEDLGGKSTNTDVIYELRHGRIIETGPRRKN